MSPSLSLSRVSRTFRTLVHRKKGPKETISSSPLCNLPRELLLGISTFLNSSSLCSLRLTCKLLYDLTLPQFGQKYLETVKTDLSLASLQRLDTLSKDVRLCPHVRSLCIDGTDEDVLGSGLEWERNASELVITSQESVQRWQDTLLRLGNCQSFHLHKHFTTDSPRPANILTPCDTVTIFFGIIAAIERPLRELSILFKPPNCTGANRIDMSRVDKGLLREPKFITTCSSLEALAFTFAMETDDEVDFVIELLRHAPHLQRLRIDADYGDHSTTLMSRLYSSQLTFSLRELTLETAHIGSADALNEFLASFEHSLAKVSFAAIHIDSGEWASVFRNLSKFPSLTDVSTYFLGQAGSQRIHFPAVLQDPVVDPVLRTKFSYTVKKFRQGQRTLVVSYSGPGIDIALEKLAAYATHYSLTG
ncbi:hypothetical protein AJ79_09679 [Helicocarpus griseus UAMH5409]|uniref:F-box domain-containing protein n=1 Tax=Helicocarpus griseus UAMH5409 TaxID=1447875 RepID=A0A2B7WI86_9EURO|nr:hypothetical protein AJ79_09679 [Helicocarpus griseus UAMH5409]